MMLDPGNYNGTYSPEAGNIALDFANTLGWRHNDPPHEWLDSYSNLVAWGKLVGTISSQEASLLLRGEANRPERAEDARLKAIELRELIYRMFSAVAAGHSPGNSEIEKFNEYIAEAFVHLRVVPEDSAFALDWTGPDDALDQMIWPVVKAAVDLLTSDQLSRVGECHGEGCGWMFLDMSRNHSRRWCSMEDCGNREKARRHYHRARDS